MRKYLPYVKSQYTWVYETSAGGGGGGGGDPSLGTCKLFMTSQRASDVTNQIKWPIYP